MFEHCPRLIEVALPIREISAESVRDKSLRHGHISTLHLWWARRPLAASRAVVFASLVPDPDDPRCPAEFRAAVERHLKTHVPAELKYYRRGKQIHRDEDPYRPYDGMPDTLRNRLLMFIAKWSPESLAFEAGKAKKEPDPKYLLDDRSLVKWETSDPENPQGREVLRIARELVKVAYGGETPTVLDPFAGGGAIPLEAGRLGCQAIANDYNPVAYLILRATCEFPQKYGKPGWRRVGGQASSLPSLEPVSTASLFDHPALKATRRNFPHWELDGRIYYVTFSTWDRFVIPEAQRWIVLKALQHWNGDRLRLHQTVVMPDHVHALIEPLKGYELSKVLHSIKSFTANEINRELGRTGPLWQPESFDRIVRDREDYLKKWEYIRTNPVKDGLCERPEEWAWLFEDLVVKQCSLEGCPPTWVPNVLVHDVEKWANWILERARERIGHFYPPGKDGRPVVGYLWARTAPCSNPSCRGEIPLLRSLLVCNKKDKKVALTMEADKERKTVRFGIAEGKAIRRTEGTKRERGPAICPFCEQPTSEAELRRAGQAGQMGERMVAVIVEGKGGKGYRPVEETDLAAFREAAKIEVERPGELILPEINAEDADDVANSTGIRVHLYGMKTWGSLFNPRQLVAMQTFVACLREALEAMRQESEDEEYRSALGVYLGLWLDRIAQHANAFCRWNPGAEKVQHIFGRQAIPMIWDYVEIPPFACTAGCPTNFVSIITDCIARESASCSRAPSRILRGDAACLELPEREASIVVTDPPYFDAIAYADLSDFFYVWLKRALGSMHLHEFSTPLTPKSDEATALKHRHNGDGEQAAGHCVRKLAAAFSECKRLCHPGGLITVMFAHQSTTAWSALISALFQSGLNVTATYPIDTEKETRLVAFDASSLESSITVTCRPRVVGSAAAFKQVRKEIEQVVQESVKRFWSYGFRGADLIVACYGPAVGVFGKYERVEKADGTPVGIPELLDLAKQAARDAIAGEFRGDNLSALYYVWANLYGVSEQSWDDARLVVQIVGGQPSRLHTEADRQNAGPPTEIMDVARGHGIFVVDGSSCRLALLADRAGRRGLGMDPNPPLIDALHRAMLLWKQEKRRELVRYLGERDLLEDGPFWKLAQALFEVLPRDLEDWKLVNALLAERQTLRAEGKSTAYRDAQKELFD